ncbi:MAG: hypothetical protein H6704_15960 [Myxococcales bacterium]|nr:hypothetical protein [Myxococcales bacterium]
MRRPNLALTAFALAALAAGATGCADPQESEDPTTPQVEALSATDVVVGETVEFYGRNFLHGDEGSTRLRFVGTFTAADGEDIPVDFAINPTFGGTDEAAGTQILTWSRFGPFANPFTGDARPGRFTGQVVPLTDAADGTMTEGKALKVSLGVGPSLVIEAFEPFEAECGAPALRALAGIPYRFRVRAAGIKPTKFYFQLNNVNGADGTHEITHDFGRGNPVAFDEIGVDQPILFNPVPDDAQFYVTAIRAIAEDDEGNAVETALPMTVHRPVEVVYQGTYELAERYEPQPVSGCIPGSTRSVVEYQETRTETRQQSVSVTVATNWSRARGREVSQNLLEGVQMGESRSRTLGEYDSEAEAIEEGYGISYGQSTANNVNLSVTDGESWAWNMSEGETNEEYSSRMNMIFGEGSLSGTVGVSAEGSVPGFAKVSGSVETTAGVTAGASTAGTRGNRNAVTTNRGYGAGGSRSETRAFGSTLAEERSQSLSGNYALTSQRSRSREDTETRERSRVWSFSDGLAQSETVSVGQSAAEEQTWVDSESIAVSQGFVGTIPRSRVGIFYRQTTRWVRRAEVRTFDLCGVASHAGELQFNEWTWAPDLAIGESCEVVPPAPALPPAKCFIPPCGG